MQSTETPGKDSLLKMLCSRRFRSNLLTDARNAPPQLQVGERLSVLICEHFKQES